MRVIAFLCSFLFLAQVHAADLVIPDVHQVNPQGTANCSNDAPTTISVGSTDGINLFGTASYTHWLCRLKVHAGRGPGVAYLSGCADVTWSASTGEIVSITYQGSSCSL
jgi:hypothetical protein